MGYVSVYSNLRYFAWLFHQPFRNGTPQVATLCELDTIENGEFENSCPVSGLFAALSKKEPPRVAESVDLAGQWARGDEQAATALFDRYVERLIAMARTMLSEKLGRRVDAEDVVQSAYRSFFLGAREGKYVIERGGDLWRLLATITVSKVRKQAEFHHAAKRSLRREEPQPDTNGAALLTHTPEPTPDEALVLTDLLETVMRELDPVQQKMLQLRLQGYRLEEIAAETQRSERTVRRLFEFLRTRWQDASLP